MSICSLDGLRLPDVLDGRSENCIQSTISPTAAMKTIQVTGYSIFYEFIDGELVREMQPIELAYTRSETGTTTLLCLHSLSAASQTFAELKSELENQVGVVGLDQRGFGGSHRPTHDYTVDVWVEDALKLLAELRVDSPVAVYGHGLGACVALSLAGRTELDSVIVSGVALAPGEPSGLSDVIAAGDRGEAIGATLEELTGAPSAADDLTPQIVARAGRAWQAFDGRALAGSLTVPLLVLAGENDTLTPVGSDGGASWLAEATGASLVRLPGGHELPSTQPRAVVDVLHDFLERWKG